jgi:hypothetical protein
MIWIGLRARWQSIAVDDLRWGLSRAILASTGVLLFVAGAVMFRYHRSPQDLLLLSLAAVIARLAVGQIVNRVVAAR